MPTEKDIESFLNLRSVAVVGASRSRAKYGNIAYRTLRSAGFQVFAVNPHADKVEEDPAYPSLRSLPKSVDGVVVVVPPDQTEEIVREAAELGIRYVWMQPGAESREAVRYCEANGLCLIHNACILVESKRPAREG